MVTYTVHERESEAQDIAVRAEEIVFVKEGFAWLALAFPILWLLYHRMWIVLAAFVAILTLVEAGIFALELADGVAVVMTFVLSGILALQANDLRRWSLTRKGYELVDLVSGRDREECEQVFFTGWLGAQEGAVPIQPGTAGPLKSVSTPPAKGGTRGSGGEDVIGLFPEPGK